DVRVEIVDPGEERPLTSPLLVEPRERGCARDLAATLRLTARGVAQFLERIVVAIESAVESIDRSKHGSRDERRRADALAAEGLGEGRVRGQESKARVVWDAVLDRVETGEDRCVRRERERRGRKRVLEADAVRRDSVEVLRVDEPRAVARQPVDARRVER